MDWILPQLSGEILIPKAVADELLSFHSSLPDWCVVRVAIEGPLLDRLRQTVDLGEAEAIVLANELQAAVILLDDKKGLRQAEAMGLAPLALPAVLAAAKRQEIIPSLADAFDTISKRGRYRVADSAAYPLLRSVGEG